MDDISEQQQIAGEISTAISNPVGFDIDVDEDDLMNELRELEQETVEKELLNIPTPSSTLPAAKAGTKEPAKPAQVRKQVADDDEELRRMAEWAS
jgi:charged multivesicular body protein 4